MTRKELENAKSNIQTFLSGIINEVHSDFDKISDATVVTLLSKIHLAKLGIIKDLEHLNKKIQDELTWD